MTQLIKTIQNANPAIFGQDFQEAVLDGWRIREGSYIDTGWDSTPLYSVDMIRDDETVAKFKAAAAKIADKPRLTREEILAKARAAKGNKGADGSPAAVLDVDTVQ